MWRTTSRSKYWVFAKALRAICGAYLNPQPDRLTVRRSTSSPHLLPPPGFVFVRTLIMSKPAIVPETTVAGISVDPRTLERVIPESRRPDGSYVCRTLIHVHTLVLTSPPPFIFSNRTSHVYTRRVCSSSGLPPNPARIAVSVSS